MEKHELKISGISGLRFALTEESVAKLRDKAVESSMEADARFRVWARAAVNLASDLFYQKHRALIWKRIGVISFSDGDQEVMLMSVEEPSRYGGEEPIVKYRVKIKSGKYGKSEHSLEMSYILKFFTPST